jgi:hypothetical protein
MTARETGGVSKHLAVEMTARETGGVSKHLAVVMTARKMVIMTAGRRSG